MRNRYTLSALFLFFTSLLFAQTPIHPGNSSSIVKSTSATNLTVSWTAFGSATTYDYEFQIDSTGWSALTNTATASFTIPYASLAIGNVVTWRVRDNNTGVPGLFTNYSFTIGPNPTPTPLNAATGVAQSTASVFWTAFDEGGWGNGNYDVDFATDAGFTSIVASAVNTASTSLALPALAFNTTYYWRVRDTDTDGAGANGSWFTFSFTTISAPPTLSSPANSLLGVDASVNITFNWNSVTGANLYQLQVDNDPVFGSPEVLTTSATTSANDGGVLLPGIVYYWRVRSSNNGGTSWSNWSSSWNFTTEFLASPINLTVGVSIVQTFDWLNVTGATGYTLEIASDNAFTNIVLTQATVSSNYTLTAAQALVNGVTYYWRVTSNNAVPVVSGTWTFMVVQPAVPYLTNPANGGTIIGNTIYFSWYVTGLSASNFVLEISTSTNFSAPIQTFSGLTSTYYSWVYTGLTPGSTYYWRVTSKTSGGVIVNYSSTWSFVTPGMPTVYPSYPIGGVTVYSTTPSVYYYTGTYYNGQFEVRYATSSSVDVNGMLNVSATSLALTSNLYATLPALTAGATYYWQVRSSNGVNFSAWSSVQSFVVYSSTPATPVVPYLSWPVGGATVYANPPSFYWYLGTYATGLEFYFEYSSNSGFSPVTGNSGWITNLYYTLPSPIASGTWYWHVKSRLAAPPNTESAWSTTESYVIPASSSTVPTPTPTSPIGGATIYVLNPTLSYYAYSASALEYQINYSAWPGTDVNGVLNVANTTSLWTSSTSYPISGLTPGVTYYWQVRARLAATPASVSNWSTVATFTTAAGAFAVVPLIGSPNNGQSINNTAAVLSWIIPTQSSSPLTYNVEYASKPDMSDATKINNVRQPFHQVSGLNPNTTYYWRVSSVNANGTSNYSSTGTFKTNSVTDVPNEQVMPSAYELSQNYPNPFNPTTNISYSLPQNSFVTIKIYDMLGREVKTLINGEMTSGAHSIEWKGDNQFGDLVASGTYIYRITAGDFVATKKMVLLK